MALADNECTERTRSVRNHLLLYQDRKRTPHMSERLRHLRAAVEELIILVRMETGETVQLDAGEQQITEPSRENAWRPG